MAAEPGSLSEAAPRLTPESPELRVSQALCRDLEKDKMTRKTSRRPIRLGDDVVLGSEGYMNYRS